MANIGDVYIGATGSPEILLSTYGREITIIPQEFGRSGRTFGGVLKTDIVSIKYRFQVPYSLIDGESLEDIIDLYDLHEGLNLKIYDSTSTWFMNDEGTTPIVKINPISRTRFVLSNPVLWQNVDFVLDEI